jgi:PIN domain nuclease of toxin-antitoxin system
MKILLDTHTMLWWVNDHENLSQTAKSILLTKDNELYLSIASAWEVAIKVSLKKLTCFNSGVKDFLRKIDILPISLFPIKPGHVEIVEILPFIHRDPFDRIIISAAKAEGMTILTADKNIHKYDVPTIW